MGEYPLLFPCGAWNILRMSTSRLVLFGGPEKVRQGNLHFCIISVGWLKDILEFWISSNTICKIHRVYSFSPTCLVVTVKLGQKIVLIGPISFPLINVEPKLNMIVSCWPLNLMFRICKWKFRDRTVYDYDHFHPDPPR